MSHLWSPHPVQAEFLSTDVDELLFGGARGGGKTDAMLVDACTQADPHVIYRRILDECPGMPTMEAWSEAKLACSGYAAIFLRRTLPELEQLIDESKRKIPVWFPGSRWNEQKKRWKFPGGGTLVFRYLKSRDDWRHYQGHSYQWIGFEELTHFEDPQQYLALHASCRTKSRWLRCYVRATTNPGGPGHHWVKARLIDAAPPRSVVWEETKSGRKLSRMFIPALVTDNLTLMSNDPEYVARLEQLPEHERRAMLLGDWDAYEGMTFPDFLRARHVLSLGQFARMHGLPFGADGFPLIPDHWPIGMSMDWGYGSPFSIGWWTTDEWGRTYRLREFYGVKRKGGGAPVPNEGIRQPDPVIAARILALEQRWGWRGRVKLRVADPNMFGRRAIAHDLQGPPIAETYIRAGVPLIKGDNNRIFGKQQFHARLRLHEFGSGFESPAIYILDTCVDWLRTVPSLPPDPDNPNDVLKEGAEDHAWDETRYWLMSRPWAALPPRNAEERARARRRDATRRSFSVA